MTDEPIRTSKRWAAPASVRLAVSRDSMAHDFSQVTQVIDNFIKSTNLQGFCPYSRKDCTALLILSCSPRIRRAAPFIAKEDFFCIGCFDKNQQRIKNLVVGKRYSPCHADRQTDRQTTSFIDNSIESGILLGARAMHHPAEPARASSPRSRRDASSFPGGLINTFVLTTERWQQLPSPSPAERRNPSQSAQTRMAVTPTVTAVCEARDSESPRARLHDRSRPAACPPESWRGFRRPRGYAPKGPQAATNALRQAHHWQRKARAIATPFGLIASCSSERNRAEHTAARRSTAARSPPGPRGPAGRPQRPPSPRRRSVARRRNTIET